MTDRVTEDSSPQPSVPPPVRAVTEAVFTVLARVRGARPFHPKGMSFTATLTPRPGQPLHVLGTDPRGVLMRFSNAAGLPPWLPDVFGIAIRVPDGAAPGRPQDLLLSSSGGSPIVRHVLRPALGFDTVGIYSSLLLYRHRGTRELVGASYDGPRWRRPLRLGDLEAAAAAEALVFTLSLATPTGRWRPIADLRAHERLSPDESRRLRFHPWNTSAELRPIGALNHLRAGAYEASQRTATSE